MSRKRARNHEFSVDWTFTSLFSWLHKLPVEVLFMRIDTWISHFRSRRPLCCGWKYLRPRKLMPDGRTIAVLSLFMWGSKRSSKTENLRTYSTEKECLYRILQTWFSTFYFAGLNFVVMGELFLHQTKERSGLLTRTVQMELRFDLSWKEKQKGSWLSLDQLLSLEMTNVVSLSEDLPLSLNK